MSRVWALGATMLWFAACAGKSKFERPAPKGSDAGAGGGGTSAMTNGGSPGRAGTTGTPGGSSAGVEASVDPNCDCSPRDSQVSCTSDAVTLPPGFADLSSCSLPDMQVIRESCGDGFRYTLHDVMGKDYWLEVDSTGKATYLKGFGDVAALCGSAAQALDPRHLTIVMGTPNGVVCRDACTVCDPAGANNFCMTCNEDPNEPGLALQSLTDYCAHTQCPQSIDEARESLGPTCGSHRIVTHQYTGCGKVFFSRVYGSEYKLELTFDEASGKLESVHQEDTQRFGPCNTYAVQAGPAHVACAEATDCNYCLEPEGGEGGGFAFHHAVCQ